MRVAWPLTAGLWIAIHACSADPVGTTAVPPALPSSESLDVDVSFFEEAGPPQGASGENWGAAMDRIAWVDSVFSEPFQGPAAILRAAAARTPEKQSDHWRWPFSASYAGLAYEGHIGGGIAGGQTGWVMVVSAPGLVPPMIEFPWLGGTTNFGAQAGTWSLADPGNPVPAGVTHLTFTWDPAQVRIQFTRDAAVFTYERIGSGRSVHYQAFDAASTFQVRWNPESGRGAVSIAQQSNLCWDEQQRDSEC